ncbi:hypothetical protein [Spiroplasma endosymbiont of 'Nebria riversi']|uniref:hypothetical protein n=1 Tax=Spiroplasma endosymbiont of 'Nebria riversi' TaxID=2792084 RepID=UPI001C0566A6|nr:hypothetical protein [Spiroplasma endosymbiont of 'Nebria riversi']
METKQNDWVTVNIVARRKLKNETDKANLFSIPGHKGLSVWISKKCIHGSQSDKSLAVSIKTNDEYLLFEYMTMMLKYMSKVKFDKDSN